MIMYVGGTLHRLVTDNLFNMVHDSMSDLGWFNAGRKHQSVKMVAESVENRETVDFNTVALSDEEIDGEELELGSTLEEVRFGYFWDIYAESRAVGQHIAGDIRDILKGRFGTIGRNNSTLSVLDLTQASPSELFVAQIEDVVQDRARVYLKPYQANYYTVSCSVFYEYESDIFDY